MIVLILILLLGYSNNMIHSVVVLFYVEVKILVARQAHEGSFFFFFSFFNVADIATLFI